MVFSTKFISLSGENTVLNTICYISYVVYQCLYVTTKFIFLMHMPHMFFFHVCAGIGINACIFVFLCSCLYV